MKYELISWAYNGTLFDNGNDTSTQPVIVVVGIVGDPYGFVAPNVNKNMFNVIVPNKLKDLDQINAQIEAEAVAYVAATYPNV